MSLEHFRLLINKRDVNGVEEYLKNGGKVNGVFKNGMSPLLYAIRFNYLSMKDEEDETDDEDETDEEDYMHSADSDNSYYWHIEGKAFAFKTDRARQRDEIIIRILRAGADFNAKEKSERNTPYFSAIIHKANKTVIDELINAGLDINAECHPGCTPLICAIRSKYDLSVIDYLIRKGSDVNYANNVGRTPLHDAIKSNYKKTTIDYLIEKGADFNREDIHGRTAMWDAVHHKNKYELCAALISMGASANVFDNDLTSIAVELGCVSNEKYYCQESCNIENCENKQLIDLFVANGVDLKFRNEHGNTIIHLVNCMYLICLCIKSGVSVDSKNNKGHSPLLDAVIRKNVAKTRKLLDLFDADVNCADMEFRTPLHHSICDRFTSDKCLPLILLYHGANLYARDLKNDTALDLLLNICICTKREYELHNHYSIIIIQCDDQSHNLYSESYNDDNQLEPTDLCDMPAILHFLLYVDEDGLYDYYKNMYNEIFLNRCVYPFIEQRKEELNKMRSTFIKPNLSFYQFCLLKKFYNSRFVNISTEEYDDSYRKVVSEMFPLFKDIILIRLEDNRKKKSKRDLLNCLENVIIRPLPVSEKNFNVQFVFDIKYHFGRFLNCKQIYNLFKASIDQ